MNEPPLSTSEVSTSESASHPNTSLVCSECGKVCASKAGLTLHRKVHPNAPPQITSLPPTRDSLAFTCADCDFSCPTKMGLTQHRRHRHPVEHNADKLLQLRPTRLNWSPTEDMELLRLASIHCNRFTTKKELYENLQLFLKNRSTESIKKRLQALKWQPSPESYSIPPTTLTALEHHQPNLSAATNVTVPSYPAALSQEYSIPSHSLPPPILANSASTQSLDIFSKATLICESMSSDLPVLPPDLYVVPDIVSCPPDVPVPVLINPMVPTLLPKYTGESPVVLSQECSISSSSLPPPILAGSAPTQSLDISSKATLLCESISSDLPVLPPDLYIVPDNVSCLPDVPVPLPDDARCLLASSIDSLSAVSKAHWGAIDLISLASGLLNGSLDLPTAHSLLEAHAAVHFPHTYRPSKPHQERYHPAKNRKQRRRAQYAHIQTLYNHSIKDAARTVLNGSWRTAYNPSIEHTEEFRNFWSDKLSASNHPDARSTRRSQDTIPQLLNPIAPEEVVLALKDMKGTAAGLDRLKAEDLLRKNKHVIAAYLNILLGCAFVPPHLNAARVTFIPKCDNPQSPSDYRPITVASVIIRCLHKILVHRWSFVFDLCGKQFAFLKRDGCSEACALLHAILRNSHAKSQPVSMASLDLSKAFDSVSHDTILRSAEGFGAPPTLLAYLRTAYSTATTRMPDGCVISPLRGVRQGDPLSPLLFIMVIDEILELSDPANRLSINSLSVDAIAYADDLIVFSDSPSTLEKKLSSLIGAANSAGLQLNPNKSFVLNILASKKRKFVAYSPEPMHVDSIQIRALGPNDTFHYLGVDFTPLGKAPVNARKSLSEMLGELSAAPLKPQQRMHILRNHALPRLIHSLCLGVVHRKTLQSLDQATRSAVRKWLRLPPDTPVAYFHAPLKLGGHFVPHLTSSIRLIRKKRLDTLCASTSPLLRWAASAPCVVSTRRLDEEAIVVANTVISNREDMDDLWSRQLQESLDGKHLKYLQDCPHSSTWMQTNSKMFASLFTRASQLRLGLLSTKARSSRGGRTNNNPFCSRGCEQIESLSHILQRCAATHPNRCKRHNDVCAMIYNKFKQKGLSVLYEPRIVLPQGFCKPDLILVRDSCAIVHEVAICDPTRIPDSFSLKTTRYDTPEINDAIISHLRQTGMDVTTVTHVPIIVSYNGLVYRKSSGSLITNGFTVLDINHICCSAISGSLKTYDAFKRGN